MNCDIIQEFDSFEYIGYYTIKSGSKAAEAEDFFERMEAIDEIQDQLERFIEWMEKAGSVYMADIGFWFRDEGSFDALPGEKYKIVREMGGGSIDLRLYCYLLPNNVVVLFNGGLKTTRNPKDCPNVAAHFSRAGQWSKKIFDSSIETEYKIILDLDEIIL